MGAWKQSVWIERFNLDSVLRRLAGIAEDLDVGSHEELLEPLGMILDYLDLDAARGESAAEDSGRRRPIRQGPFRDRGPEPAPGPSHDDEAQLRQGLRTAFLALQTDVSLVGPFKDLTWRYLAQRAQLVGRWPEGDAVDDLHGLAQIEEACRQDHMEQLLRDIVEHTRCSPDWIAATHRGSAGADVDGRAKPDIPRQRVKLVLLEGSRSAQGS